MAETSEIKSLDYTLLTKRFEQAPPDFIITSAENFSALAKLRPPRGYTFLPPKYRRRKWQAVIAYGEAPLPPHFTANPTTIDFGRGSVDALYGLKPVTATPTGIRFRAALGPETALLLGADRALSELGSELTLTAASTLPSTRGPLTAKVFLNGQEISTLAKISEGFNKQRFFVPPGKWRSGRNVLSFKYYFADGRAVGDRAEALLFQSITIRLGADLSME